jgi:hypothetical protein
VTPILHVLPALYHKNNMLSFCLPQLPVVVGRVPECYPSTFNAQDHWDQTHVKLPCSEKNVTKVSEAIAMTVGSSVINLSSFRIINVDGI